MGRKRGGHNLAQDQVQRICKLLKETDTATADIAERFRTNPEVIQAINRKHKCRQYLPGHKNWTLNGKVVLCEKTVFALKQIKPLDLDYHYVGLTNKVR